MSFQGAEAKVLIGEKVVKNRIKKSYRHPKLDKKIRSRRTEREATLIREASRSGVSTPKIIEVNEDTIEMEKLSGEELKDKLETDKVRKLGKKVAKLHENNIIHGDLTTRNIIVSDKVYIIDFGLAQRSQRTEDRAMDIHIFKQVLETQHPEKASKVWQGFLEGYEYLEEFEKVVKQLRDIESRGRYK